MKGLLMLRKQTTARMQPPKGYITAKEAKRRLGIRGVPISDGMLRSYVQKGEIERKVPDNRVQGYYKAEDVDKVVQALRAFYGEPSAEIQFRRTTEQEDVAECIQIDKEVYGSPGTPIETRLSWLQKNPELLYVLKSDHVAGYASVLPLKREKIDAILREKIYLKELTADDIETFEPGKPLDIYIYSVAIRPEYEKEEKRVLASQLISGLMHVLLEWGQRGVILRTFLARSRFADGMRLLSDMGFSEYPLTKIPDARFSYFILEVDKSDAPFVKRYKRAILKAQKGKTDGNH